MLTETNYLTAQMARNALSNRFEDALDFLETLPDMIELCQGSGTAHYLIEPEDVIRIGDNCLIVGAALLVQLALARTGYRTELICDKAGLEEIVLYIDDGRQT